MGEKNVDESMDENVGAAVKKTALKVMKKKPLPCGKKKSKRVSIFSPWRKKMVSVEPYSATAKRLYRWYIQELDFDAGWIAPPNLKFHEESGRFTRVKPKVETRTAYKKYLSCHRIHNVQKVMGFEGFELLRFPPAAAGGAGRARRAEGAPRLRLPVRQGHQRRGLRARPPGP